MDKEFEELIVIKEFTEKMAEIILDLQKSIENINKKIEFIEEKVNNSDDNISKMEKKIDKIILKFDEIKQDNSKQNFSIEKEIDFENLSKIMPMILNSTKNSNSEAKPTAKSTPIKVKQKKTTNTDKKNDKKVKSKQ